MRVIAGSLGGRVFDTPKGQRTHPMGDRVKGGLFNALGDITNLTVLDAFAGSGALSIEAISRGADSSLAIDFDKKAFKVLTKNIGELKLKDKIKAVNANVSSWSDNNNAVVFDLALADPPYDNLQLSLIQKLTRHIKDGGLYVVSWPVKLNVPVLDDAQQIKLLEYGDAQLVFYRKTE